MLKEQHNLFPHQQILHQVSGSSGSTEEEHCGKQALKSMATCISVVRL